MFKKKKPQQGSKLLSGLKLDDQPADSLFELMRKPKPGEIIFGQSDVSEFSVEEILHSNIASDLFSEYDFFKSDKEIPFIRIAFGGCYSYADLKSPVCRHIIELNGLLKGIELEADDVEKITGILEQYAFHRSPLIAMDEADNSNQNQPVNSWEFNLECGCWNGLYDHCESQNDNHDTANEDDA